MYVKELKSVGFTNDYEKPFCWTVYIDGYYFVSDGKTIEWDGDMFDDMKPLHIKDIERFKNLIFCLTEKQL